MPERYLNHLAGETSPYLLQHAANPVDWYPWSEEALKKAAVENKLMIISIGYAACHWCHVMEKESFEDREVAEMMNSNFISIKVDREERPDVDQVYMNAAYVVTGRGGWPLNVITLPDGRPVYAGTYFRKRDWLFILRRFSDTYRVHPSALTDEAEEIYRQMKQADQIPRQRSEPVIDLKEVNTFAERLGTQLDHENGGTSGAPKFPMPSVLSFLMEYSFHSGNKPTLSFVELSLKKMACGGIFDHLGGGFCRYSTDDQWHVPHFEKMLYDNSQLVTLYSHGYKLNKNPLYKEVVYDTLGFIERELTSPAGLFYSSIDADSEGREGAFYTWTFSEIERLLGQGNNEFMEFFRITGSGNWENGENILWNPAGVESNDRIRAGKEILFKARENRIRPALDNKIITSWNGMMISAYADAASAFNENQFLENALKAALIYKKIIDEHGQLFRLIPASGSPFMTNETMQEGHKEGFRKVNAFLDDYALMIKAFTDLYQLTFDIVWLGLAEQLVNYTIEHFLEPGRKLFWFTSGEDPAMIDRRMEVSDNVIPASNSVMAGNLFLLGHLLGKEKWILFAEEMVSRVFMQISAHPVFGCYWAKLFLEMVMKPYEVSITGKDWKAMHHIFREKYLPNVIFSGGKEENSLEILRGKFRAGKTSVYICRDKTCSAPFDNAEEALKYLPGKKT